MKRLLMILFMAYVFMGTASASQWLDSYDLLKSATATGAGTVLDLGNPTFSEFTCAVTWGGTTPTNTVVDLEGSIDNSTYDELATETITATGTMFHVVDKPVRYIRGEYVSKSGGDATTAVTLKCSAVAR